jgi:TRAP-type C4-dicarboxylate transport system substrate-binding protein
VARPDDLRRLKVFVTAGDNAHADLMRSEGFTPVSLEWADVLTSLQTGIVDAVPTIPYYALSMQLYTVARNMTAVHWAPLVGGMVMTRSAWEALSPEAREAVRAAAVAAGRQFEARGRLEADSAVGAMQRRGLAVRTLTPAEEAEWRTMAERLYPRIRGSMVPAEQFDEVMRVLSEVRARPGQPR